MPRRNIFIFAFICLICAFSNVSAYQSFWDNFSDKSEEEKIISGSESTFISIKQGLVKHIEQIDKNPFAVPVSDKTIQTLPESDTRSEGFFSVDSIQVFGETNQETVSLIQALTGLRIDFSNQEGSLPLQSCNISLKGNELFSHTVQKTEPYYIQNSYLGESSYLISSEDQFEEKLVNAIYRLLESLSDSQSDLPDIQNIYLMIRTIRQNGGNLSSGSLPGEISFDGKIDTSAFDNIMLDVLMKVQNAEPDVISDYLFREIPQTDRKYRWPDVSVLPTLQTPASAVSLTLLSKDFVAILDSLSRFFADNPDFTAMVNAQIKQNLSQTGSSYPQNENMDYLSEIITGLKEGFETDMKGAALTIKINQDENQQPLLITVEFSDMNQETEPKLLLAVHSLKEEMNTCMEFAVDIISGNTKEAVFRAIAVNKTENEQSGNFSLNFIFGSGNNDRFEYSQSTDSYLASTMTQVSNTEITFDFSEQSGNLKLTLVGIPNQYNGKDMTGQISYMHLSQGTPAFSLSASFENKGVIPVLESPFTNVISASKLTIDEYDEIAAQIFMQLMSIMNFV